ncbi:MAG: protein-glutamate O-methyltransferase CheR [Pseudomonadota bacterium]
MGHGPPPVGRPLDDETFAAIAAVAHAEAGLKLEETKRAMVTSRLMRRVARLGLRDLADYVPIISEPGAAERRRMVSALTTNVSSFFREIHHFEALRHRILPPLLAAARSGARVRIWSAGAAHGQEAYSIALTVLDLEPRADALDIRILGTDIDPSVIRHAQLAAYHRSMLGEVPERLRQAYFSFDTSSETFLATAPLRALVLFRELNLHGPWPMPGRFDVIFCRNVVIYFDEAGQEALWPRFEDKLSDGGWLMVGHSERIPRAHAPRLEAREHTIYQRAR